MKIKFLVITTLIFLFYSSTLFATDSEDKGKAIFTTRCASCHNVNAQVVGPALAKVDERHPVEWIVNFVHSSKTMIDKKDTAAVALYNKFNHVVMPDHQDLSADDIKNVLAYIKSETKTVTAMAAPFARPGSSVLSYKPLSFQEHYSFFVAFVFAVFVMVGLFVFAVRIKDLQREKVFE